MIECYQIYRGQFHVIRQNRGRVRLVTPESHQKSQLHQDH